MRKKVCELAHWVAELRVSPEIHVLSWDLRTPAFTCVCLNTCVWNKYMSKRKRKSIRENKSEEEEAHRSPVGEEEVPRRIQLGPQYQILM